MQQFYLIRKILGQQMKDKLAEEYLDNEQTLNPLILEPLSWILTTLKYTKLDANGDFCTLQEKIDKNGKRYYCIEDCYYSNITQQQVKYEIVKKLNITDHVYEVRFQSKSSSVSLRNCRVIITLNPKKNYVIWTHGFTKFPNATNSERREAKEQTNRLGQIAKIIYTDINNHSDVSYIGKKGKRHEVTFGSE